MWGLREWVGPYFPPTTRTGQELGVYATWCTAVEGNTTFYGLPTAAAVDRWRDAVPADFRFVFKLPRTITHDRRLRNTGDLLREFCHVTEPLEAVLGPTSIQLPATFDETDMAVLEQFIVQLSTNRRWAVEVRNPAFFAGGPYERQLDDLLYANGLDRVILDSRAVFDGPRSTPAEIEAFENKPRLPVRPTATAEFPIVRFIGQTAAEANPPYWRRWVDKVATWLDQGRSPIVFVHTPDNVVALGLARQFYDEVRANVSTLVELPTPVVSEQSALF